jgi:hypothetical protein
MKRVIAIAVVSVAASASAWAQPKRGGGVPTRAVPCLEDGAELFSGGAEQPILCGAGGCMKLELHDGTARSVAKPAAVSPWLEALPEVRTDEVCAGSTCKKLGKKVAAAVVAARAEKGAGAPRVTSDLKVVVVGGQAWNVASDKPLRFVGPRAQGSDKPMVVGLEVAGKFLVVNWSACAGPCTENAVVDANGRNIGGFGTGGQAPFQLDANRFVVTGEYATMQIYDLGTGKSRGRVALDGEPTEVTATRLDDTSIAVLYKPTEMNSHVLAVIDVPVEKKEKPRVSRSMALPSCTP